MPTHCTGFEAALAFARELPNPFILNTAGTRYVLASPSPAPTGETAVSTAIMPEDFLRAINGRKAIGKQNERRRGRKDFPMLREFASIALLLLAGAPAWAQLTEIATRNEQTLLLDTETIQKDGALRRAWTVCNYTVPNAHGAMSTRSLMEYDCAASRYRILILSTHSECMAEGPPLHVEATASPWWRDIPSGTVAARLLGIVCAQ